MLGERIKGCFGKSFLLLLVLAVVTAVALYLIRAGGGGASHASGEENGPLKADQTKHPSGPAELRDLQHLANRVRTDSRALADGTTKVNQLVLWQIDEHDIYFRIILTPYDGEAHQMMTTPSEALFLSFETKAGERVAPKAEPLRIAMRQLRIATENGSPAGWFMDGKIPLDPKAEREIDLPRVGWLFSKRLHARLRQVRLVTPTAAE